MTQSVSSQQTSGLLDLLLRAGDAWRNWRALLVLAGTALLFVVLIGAGGAGAASGSGFVAFIAGLIAFFILLTGFSAAGVLLMDQATEMTPRGIGAAIVDGFFCTLRYIVLALAAFLVTALFAIVVAILLYLCKIPGLGAVLYAVLFPALAIISAFFFAAYYLFFLLAGPTLWSGSTLREAIARLYAIITQKPAQAIIAALMLSILVALVSGILFTAVTAGVFFVGGLSAPILGGFGGLESMMMGNMGMGRGFQGLAVAGAFGTGLVYALVAAAVFVVMILGSCYVYLHLTADMDFAAAEAALEERMRKTREQASRLKEEAERRAREAKEEAQRRTEAMRVAAAERAARKAEEDAARAAAAVDAADAPATETAPPAAAAANTCPACQSPVHADDMFCGNCGHRLKQPG